MLRLTDTKIILCLKFSMQLLDKTELSLAVIALVMDAYDRGIRELSPELRREILEDRNGQFFAMRSLIFAAEAGERDARRLKELAVRCFSFQSCN